MPTHIALLRGINIGANKRVAMPALRELAEGLGHEDVSTYIASGNLLFTTKKKDAGKLAAELERAIAKDLDVDCRVIVLSRADLARVIEDNPYPKQKDPKKVHATFLSEKPSADLLERVDAAVAKAAEKGGSDEAQVVGRTLFIHTPDGYGRSDLAATLTREGGKKAVRTAGTARNWATVTKLLELAKE